DEWHLGNDALDTPVNGSYHQDVTTAITRPPDTDALTIDFRPRSRIGDGMPVIAHLRPGIDLLSWLAVAGPKVTVVEYQGTQPRICEDLGKAVEVHLFHSREAVGHNDSRKWPVSRIRGEQPTTRSEEHTSELQSPYDLV